MSRRPYPRWRDPFRLTRSSIARQLEGYLRSHVMPRDVRLAIGLVLARADVVREDDLAALLTLTREQTYRRATVADVVAAARLALEFADLGDGRRSA